MRRVAMLLLPTLLAGCGTDVSGPGGSLLSCLYAAGASLGPAGVLQVQGDGDQGICLDGATEAGEFLYVPFFATAAPDDDETAPRASLAIRGIGLKSGTAGESALRAPDPVWLPGAGEGARAVPARHAPDWSFHDRLRRREIRELGPKIRAGTAPVRSAPAARAAVPEIGDLAEYNTAVSCEEEDIRTGRVVYVSEHAVVVADVDNPANLDAADYAYFGITFDTLVYPVETAHFGAPTDIDGNGRSILFFTRAVNERNPRSAETVTIGFFWSGDLFPDEGTSRLEGCPGGNNAEMFYLVAPDPQGQAGRPFTLEDVRKLAVPLIGHEFQHLVNASRRLFVNEAGVFEEPWLNEGLSHIAEELLFYEVAGLQPLRNLTADDLRDTPGAVDAFNEYMVGNLTNMRRYLSRPDTTSLMGGDDLTTRGASWAFLRYAADRSGRDDAEFLFDVVNSLDAGLDNLRGVMPEGPLAWMQDWIVSVYADDLVPGIDERFTTRSWDLRAVFEGSTVERYPLQTLALDPGTDTRVDLRPGGAAFTLFDLPPGGSGVVHVRADGRIPTGSLRGSVLRIR